MNTQTDHFCTSLATGASYVCRVPMARTHLHTRLDDMYKYGINVCAWICACAETSPLFAHTHAQANRHLFRTAAPRPGWQATSQSLRVGGRVNTRKHPSTARTHPQRVGFPQQRRTHAITVRHNLDRYTKCSRNRQKNTR